MHSWEALWVVILEHFTVVIDTPGGGVRKEIFIMISR